MVKPPSPVSTHDDGAPFDDSRLREEETTKEAANGNAGLKDRCLTSTKRRVHVEVLVHSMCPTKVSTLRQEWEDYLKSNNTHMKEGELDFSAAPDVLTQSCKSATVVIDDSGHGEPSPHAREADLHVHPFKLSEEEPATEELQLTGGDEEWTPGCDNLTLPHVTLDGIWESLILPHGTKRHLLEYAQSALLFSDKGVSPHIVSWNRLLLLHGPPGTGKTTLCRSLAHKLAIRMGHRFPSGANLLEIHSHSLFSKWFSTSGKLINRLFEVVRDMVQDDQKSLVCVLVDEVESLAGSRSALGGAGEPSDAMRAVNALLTSLDRLRTFPNVLVLATTNLSSSVDAAFVDRADLKLHIGLPILEARYEILRSCVLELVRVGIVESQSEESLCSFHDMHKTNAEGVGGSLSRLLLRCAEAADGLSGRSLRRLPLQSHALYVRTSELVSLEDFLSALQDGIAAEQGSREQLDSGKERYLV